VSLDPVDVLRAEIVSGPRGPQIGAFFDFDGTVIHGYSGGVFFRQRLRAGQVNPVDIARALQIGLTVDDPQEKYDRFLAHGFASWAGRGVDEMEEFGERLFRQEIAASIYPDAGVLIQAHQSMRHTVALASSASRFQVEPAASELQVEHVVCTRLEEEDGLLTGRIIGPIAAGPGKADAVLQFAAEHEVDLSASYGYANGDEDIPFLETVGNPRPVNPQGQLARHAAQRGWPVRRLTDRGRPDPLVVGRSLAALTGAGLAVGVGVGLGALNRNRRQAVDLSVSLAADVALAIAGVEVIVDRGEEHLWAHRPAVFVFNHQSNGDALVLAKLLRRGFSGVAKKEVAAMPVVGQFMRLADVAFVDRANSADARAALAPAVERLQAGTSLVVSPEGTRALTSRPGRFKRGAFHVARAAGVPVVPIVLRDVGRRMSRSARTMRPGVIRAVVLPPVFPEEWAPEEVGVRVDQLRESFEAVLADWRGTP
jgi:HAD superfamily hydrolase (TIGR01490 family)